MHVVYLFSCVYCMRVRISRYVQAASSNWGSGLLYHDFQACGVVFPSTPQDALLWHFGDSIAGAWMGIRNSSARPILRGRVGKGGVINTASNSSGIGYVDIADFPRDGAAHTVVVEIGMPYLQVHTLPNHSYMSFSLRVPMPIY